MVLFVSAIRRKAAALRYRHQHRCRMRLDALESRSSEIKFSTEEPY